MRSPPHTCFKCAHIGGKPRRGFAMHPSWYETRLPGRTVYLCDGCYLPDPLAGRRKEAAWETHEAIWEATAYVEEWDGADDFLRAYEDAQAA